MSLTCCIGKLFHTHCSANLFAVLTLQTIALNGERARNEHRKQRATGCWTCQSNWWKRLAAPKARKHQALCTTNIKVGYQDTPQRKLFPCIFSFVEQIRTSLCHAIVTKTGSHSDILICVGTISEPLVVCWDIRKTRLERDTSRHIK